MILNKLSVIFKEAFGKDTEISLATRKEDIATWDSINFLNLIIEIESEFDLSLEVEEIEKINSVSNIISIIENRKN